jgi:hypothetical protein
MFLTDKNSRLLLWKYLYRLLHIYCSYILRFWNCRSVKNFSIVIKTSRIIRIKQHRLCRSSILCCVLSVDGPSI